MVDELQAAANLYDSGKHRQSFDIYIKEAEKGCVACQRFVGWMYFRGEGVSQNVQKANNWMTKAADAGDLEAMFGLGRIFMSESDFENAMHWYQKGMDSEFLPAIYWVARFKRDGLGCAEDKKEALLTFRKSALLGHLQSLREYAVLLMRGDEGVLGRIRGMVLFVRFIFMTVRFATTDRMDYRVMI